MEKSKVCFAIFFFIAAITINYGQSKMIDELTYDKNAIENIKACIKSENRGVRESSIYLAGLYKMIVTEDALIAQLKREPLRDLKVLIALALFRMHSEKGMKELPQIILNDKDKRVIRMCHAIYSEYLKTKFINNQMVLN